MHSWRADEDRDEKKGPPQEIDDGEDHSEVSQEPDRPQIVW